MEELRRRPINKPQPVTIKSSTANSSAKNILPGLPKPTPQDELRTLRLIASNATMSVPPPLNSYITKVKQLKDLAPMYPKLFELGNRVIVPVTRVKELPAYKDIPYDKRGDDIAVLVSVARSNLDYYQKFNLLILLLNIILNTTQYLQEWIEDDYYLFIKKKRSNGTLKEIYDLSKQPIDKVLRDPEYEPDLVRFFSQHKTHRPELYNATISILSDCYSQTPSDPASIASSVADTPTASSFSSAPSDVSSISSLSTFSSASVDIELKRRKQMSATATLAAGNLTKGYNNAAIQILKNVLNSRFNSQRIISLNEIDKQLKRKFPTANTLRLLKELAETHKFITVSQGDVVVDWVQATF